MSKRSDLSEIEDYIEDMQLAYSKLIEVSKRAGIKLPKMERAMSALDTVSMKAGQKIQRIRQDELRKMQDERDALREDPFYDAINGLLARAESRREKRIQVSLKLIEYIIKRKSSASEVLERLEYYGIDHERSVDDDCIAIIKPS